MEVSFLTVLLSTAPALVTGAVAVIVSRHQLKMKIAEIRGNSEYKARENLWHIKQKRRDGITQGVQQAINGIGELIGGAAAIVDAEARASHLRGALFLARWFKGAIGKLFDTIKDDLREKGLDNKENLDHLALSERIILQDMDSIKDEELEEFFIEFSKAILYLGSLADEVQEKEAAKLFAPYLDLEAN